MPQIEGDMRRRIAKFLPCALEKALSSYRAFSGQGETGEAKAFKAHHDACKVAIAHIDLLIKLARWADLPDPNIEDARNQTALMELIESAQAEIHETDQNTDIEGENV